MIKQLSYRFSFQHEEGIIRDVFDSTWYHSLLNQNVVIDGVERDYTYFSHKHDLVLSLAVDGFLLFDRKHAGPSATPIILQNLNLPPGIRTHFENIICVGVIPGPNQRKDLGSFLSPLDDECALLADGICTYDAQDEIEFSLHGYIMFKNGDILAIEKLLNIKGVRNIGGAGTIYYTPLTTPDVPNQTRPSADPDDLPLRSHGEFIHALEMMNNASTQKEHDDLAKKHGIRGEPALRQVKSINYAISAPWEWMHLFLKNVVPTLVRHWTGQFKGLDSGTGSYEIEHQIWDEIGAETAAVVKEIPSAFVGVLPNIADNRSSPTAEFWGFWFMYIAPIVLRGHFLHDKYSGSNNCPNVCMFFTKVNKP